MRMKKSRSLIAGTLALGMTLLACALAAPAAQAQMGPPVVVQRRFGIGAAVGAAIAGAAVGAAIGLEIAAPSVYVDVAPPPPPPCCYVAPPPPAPPVVVVQQAPPAPPPRRPAFGVSIAGLVQAPQSGQQTIGGVAASFEARTSRHSLLALELQSLGGRRESDDTRRNDLAALMAGRLFFWDAAFAPYVDLAGGVGRAVVDSHGLELHASQLIGRAGLGFELRLGPNVVLNAEVADVHRLRLDTTGDSSDGATVIAGAEPIGQHERSTEIRGGLGVRF